MLNLYRKTDDDYRVVTDTGIYMGSMVRDADGFFYFWANTRLSGCSAAWTHRWIADKLDVLNQTWGRMIDDMFKEEPK